MAADWILIEAGKSLFAAFNTIAPNRAHNSDGSIGDAAHQREVSDHNPDETGAVPIHDADHTNEVHAIDVDSDLRTPGLTMEMVIQFTLARCRSGAERRLRYMIFDRRIWEGDNGWRQRAYTGSSPHTEHAHFSFSYVSSLEASSASWHLEEIPVSLTPEDRRFISDEIQGILTRSPLNGPDGKPDGTYTSPVGEVGWKQGMPDPTLEGEPRQNAYQVVRNIGRAVVGLEAALAEIKTTLADIETKVTTH